MKLSELEILIDRYLSGQASEEEKALVENWLQHNAGNAHITDPQKREELLTAIWGNVLSGIKTPEKDRSGSGHGTGVVRSLQWLQKKYLIKAAASILFVAMAGVLVTWLIRKRTSPSIVYASITASDTSARQHILPDGSKAWLFPGSAIEIPENYNLRNRHVKVNGRAFFEVQHDTTKPFYVDAGPLQTRVLGTSFEVNTLQQQHPSVIVRTGRVAVSYEGKSLTQLTLNKRIILDVSSNNPTGKIDSVNAAALCNWWNGAFNFEQTPLPEVLQNLSQWYKIPITIEGNRWQKEKVTVQLETSLSLEDALHFLAATLGTKYTKTGAGITVY